MTVAVVGGTLGALVVADLLGALRGYCLFLGFTAAALPHTVTHLAGFGAVDGAAEIAALASLLWATPPSCSLSAYRAQKEQLTGGGSSGSPRRILNRVTWQFLCLSGPVRTHMSALARCLSLRPWRPRSASSGWE
jgi:hypothetical protein